MPILHNSIVPAAADSTPADPVTRSLLKSASTQKLARTPSGGETKTWTMSCWVKKHTYGITYQTIANAYNGSASNSMTFGFNSDEKLWFHSGGAVGEFCQGTTTRVFRDSSSWYHLCLVLDATLSNGPDRVKLWVNGEPETMVGMNGHNYYPSQNPTSLQWNGNWENVIFGTGNANNLSIADFYFLDGNTVSTPVGNFIESNDYGGYKPKAFDMSSYGGNSWHLDMQPANDSDLMVSSVGRNDGDTTFVDVAKGHTITKGGDPEHSDTVGNPFDSSGTAISFDGTGDYLSVATSSDFDFGSGSYTYEGWFYFNGFSETPDGIFSRNNSSTQEWSVCTNSSGELQFFESVNNTYNTSSFTFSTGQWYHIALCKNGTTYKVYVDADEKISATLSSAPDDNLPVIIGRFYDNYNGYYLDGYCFDFRAQKGVDTGGSKPSAPFELNPVYIGGDQSGNKNHFTPTTGISTTDIREDNPFKNHATWNPLIKRSSTSNIFTYSEGNTVATYTGGVAHTSTTIASTGVHYAEFAFSGGTSSISGAGVVRARWNGGSADSYTTTYGGCYYGSSGNVDSPSGSTSVSAVGSDRLGIAFDGANNKADFYSVTSGGTMTLLKSLTSSDSINFDGSATFTATSHDTGATTITGYFEEGEWYGTAPSVGSTTATALNTSNLSTPTVTPAENFAAAKYEGAGGSEEINLGFTPALTWIKRREDSGYYHGWYDSVRGLSSGALASNDASNEDGTQRVSSFDSDTGSEGFTLSSSHYSYTNTSGKDFISWSWKAHQGGPVTRSHTMTLEVNDLWGNATDWDSTKLEVWEGATKLADISQPAYNGGSSTTYTIKTNDTDKIKVVWDVDSSMDWTAMYAVLKNSSNTTLASWDGSSYYGGSTPADGSNFYIPSGHDSYNAAVTGVVEGPTTVVESYNAAAGFSIITYSGNGSSDGDTQDLTHTLGAEPEFIITKARTDSNGADGGWNVYHKHNVASGSGSHPLQWLHHNWDSYKVTYAPVIPKSGSENTTIQVNNDSGYGHSSNDSGATYVAYAWTPVAGYSHFGLWEASGNNPQFYHLGFRPAFVILKCVNVNSTNWIAFDSSRETFNQIDHPLFPNTSGDEPSSGWGIDFLSNGFAWRSTSIEGQSGRKYIVCAWAETPARFANAR